MIAEQIAAVLAEHQLVGASMWACECMCGGQEGVDYYAHLAAALLPLLDTAAREAAAKAWDEAHGAFCPFEQGFVGCTFHANPYREGADR